MQGLSLSALLVGWLHGHRLPGLDEDWAQRDALLLRLGVILLAQLVLFVGLTAVVLG